MSAHRLLLLRSLLRLVHAAERAPRAAAAVLLSAALLPAAAARGCQGPSPTLSTFNIRRFGVEPTDVEQLSAMIERLGADVIAVQEIQRPDRLDELASRLGGKRHYRAVTSECAGRRQMHVGFLYDERRARLLRTEEFRELLPDEGGCAGDRPGLLGVFEVGGQEIHALVVHLKAGGHEEAFRERVEQWKRLDRILSRLDQQGARRVVLLGDMNSTGYLDNARGERDMVEGVARGHRLDVVTSGLGCTEYYQASDKLMAPSLLDHALVTRGALVDGSVQVHSHCAELRCAPRSPSSMPPSYTDVSDHCPVTLRLGR